MKSEWKAVIIMLGIGLILSLWGLGKYAGAGCIGAGLYNLILMYFKYSKKEKGESK